MNDHDAPRLTRASAPVRAAAPVRIVHLGLGNFVRAHLAWYTEHAPDAEEWGIAAFTGRRPAAAELLAPQDGLYTLLERHAEADSAEIVSAIVAVHTAAEHEAWLGYLASPEVAVVSLTVTEAGYRRDAEGSLDLTAPDVAEDLEALRADLRAPVSTAVAKIVGGLAARRAAAVPGLTLLPLDNLPGNGEVLRGLVGQAAQQVDPGLAEWIDATVDVASTMVDRITPRVADAGLAAARELVGFSDATPVVTEPFSEWVISGAFTAGRPRWEEAGARFVADVEAHELRKLYLLNGAHSLMAYAASQLGHRTVDEAIADERVRGWVEHLWAEAAAVVPVPELELAVYRRQLLERFENPRMGDLLARIAADGSQKLPVRIVPVVRAERAAGRLPHGGAVALGAWIAHLRGHGAPVTDAAAPQWRERAAGEPADAVDAVLDALGLGGDPELAAAVAAHVSAVESGAAESSAAESATAGQGAPDAG